MNNFAVFVFFAVCGLASCLPDGDTYTSKFDSIFQDTDNLKNPRLLKKYIDCLLDDKLQCPKEAEELKAHIKEALQDGCAHCTEQQKVGLEAILEYIIENQVEWWEKLEAKYDSDHIYRGKHPELFKKA